MIKAPIVLTAVLVLLVSILVPSISSAAAEVGSSRSPIQHVVVIVQENHSFDSYFANYCRGRVDGKTKRPVCDGGPSTYPGTSVTPVVLDDATNAAHDPNHLQSCELAEIDAGKMDRFLNTPRNPGCGDRRNFAYAAAGASSPLSYYYRLATTGALADRYFQPVAGQSTANDLYLWTTRFVFPDNAFEPLAVGYQCSATGDTTRYDDMTDPAVRSLGKLLSDAHVTWAWYAEGYSVMRAAGSTCPEAPAGCPRTVRMPPCVFAPAGIPSQFYASSVDDPAVMHDYSQLATDLVRGTLPSVVFVKALSYRTEHPGLGQQLSPGVQFVHDTIDAVEHSKRARHTLVLLTYDESGGYYDHVAPPATSAVDGHAYGPRVPLLAVGPFARKGIVSHTVMEHSSIVRFIEWNWLHTTGQLHGRDAHVHNLGSMLDPSLHVPT